MSLSPAARLQIKLENRVEELFEKQADHYGDEYFRMTPVFLSLYACHCMPCLPV
jgi:hypothetical protein